MKINSKIFKAYDIRGVYPTDLNEPVAEKVGRAFAAYLRPERVVVGRDARLSSDILFEHLTAGLLESGVDVYDIGLCSTDVFYFACGKTGLPGLMITASHNPKEYNGFKMVRQMPHFLSGQEGIPQIKDLVESENFGESKNKGKIEKLDIWSNFTEKALSLIDVSKIKPLKIVADAGNGTAGLMLQRVFQKLPVKLIPLFFEPDGNFPNRGPDPLKEENRVHLSKKILEEKADAGFAFDADADRFFVLDNKAQFIPGDFLTAILSKHILKENEGASIVYDLRASWAVKDTIEKAGGRALMNRVGHSFIKERMQKEGAVFAGEVSGHYYFKDFFYADSGIVPALKIVEILSDSNQKMSEIIQPFWDKYFISGEINSEVKDQKAVLQKLKERFKGAPKVYEMDGFSVEYADWHFNVRPSNTEPFLRLNLEAKSKELMEEKKEELLKIIRE